MAGIVPAIHVFRMRKMRTRTTTELIHEGKYAAEVEIVLHYSEESWSPTMSGVRLPDSRCFHADAHEKQTK